VIYFFARQPDGTILDISSYVNLQDPSKISLTMNAEQGSVGTSNIPIEDPNGTLLNVGLRLFNVYDDLASFLITYSGYTAERGISRDTYRAGTESNHVRRPAHG
jgi:hypothetical protein